MKGDIEWMMFMVIQIVLIGIFTVLVFKAVGAVFNPDKEVVVLNTELLRAKINEACQFPGKPVDMEKLAFPQPKPSRVFGVTDFLPTYAISGSGAADPHYVLYYEAFPPGEAIGWEAYENFNTRFIAPFDYAKYTGTDKLAKGAMISSPEDVKDFLDKMKDYEKSIITKAGTFVSSEITEGDKKITVITSNLNDLSPWEKKEHDTKSSIYKVEYKDGELYIRTSLSPSVVFKIALSKSSSLAVMEAKLRLKKGGFGVKDAEGKIFLSIRNTPYRVDLKFHVNKIVLENAETKVEYTMDTTKEHVYKLKINDSEAEVYVDNELQLTGKAKSGTENAFLWGAGNADDWEKGLEGITESYWRYVSYGGDKVEISADVEERFELAKKPVLINNIILSDSLNVIPTEKAKPPESITKTSSEIGNVGEWNGDRFEFTDYFGITKEERAYIKYRACGENALCLKTRDAVQAFPLDNACRDVQYIQIVYDASGLKLEDLMPAAFVARDIVGYRILSKMEQAFGKKAASTAPSVVKGINTDALFRGTATEFIDDIDDVATVTKKTNLATKSIKKLGSFGKGLTKTVSKKSLGKLVGKFGGPLKMLLVMDIILQQSPDMARNVMESTLRYKNSEFYLASPCQLQSGKMTIKYDEKCQVDEQLCAKGISYPLYEYKVEFDGTKTIRNVGSHFMCLKSVGKDKDEAEEYKDKYKTEIDSKMLPENIGCIKIQMEDVKRKDFCWTNNPVYPEKDIGDRLLGLVPGKTEALDALIGCGVGAVATIWTGPGFLLGCAAGAGTSLTIDEASNLWGLATGQGLKEQLFIRAGGLPVTEGTSYITYTEDDKTDASKKYLEAIEMAPTDVIGGNAAKRFGEITKNFFEIHWAWPR